LNGRLLNNQFFDGPLYCPAVFFEMGKAGAQHLKVLLQVLFFLLVVAGQV
jgi:hypothetical protein